MGAVGRVHKDERLHRAAHPVPRCVATAVLRAVLWRRTGCRLAYIPTQLPTYLACTTAEQLLPQSDRAQVSGQAKFYDCRTPPHGEACSLPACRRRGRSRGSPGPRTPELAAGTGGTRRGGRHREPPACPGTHVLPRCGDRPAATAFQGGMVRVVAMGGLYKGMATGPSDQESEVAP